MSNPMITRYHMMWNKDEDGSIYVSPWPSGQSGDWVKYEDYARLLCDSVHDLNQIGGLQEEVAGLEAEVERLRASSFVTAVPVEQYERVVKAGDAMASDVGNSYESQLSCVQRWQAAKEGKTSV